MAALTVSEDQRREELDTVDHAAKVHPHRAVPAVEIRIVDVATAADTGVVAQDVYLAEYGHRLVGRAAQLVALTHIDLYAVHVPALPQQLAGLLQMITVEVGNHDVHAFPQEVLDHAQANAARATGHEGRSALEELHAKGSMRVSALRR